MVINNMLASRFRHSAALFMFIVIATVSLFLALSFGATDTSINDVFNSLVHFNDSSLTSRIIFELRVPRTLLAFLAGAGLAIAGLILQAVTRNPLADPYLLVYRQVLRLV
eukprot:TRINITY_DN27104_c0_g1_i1.p1 TRINITY_DN27104_c0_g1~~TRINITY_DN27104_c0_g1_i1.p1  ORF type:complete len:110 (+),score=11.76 TRINITY_DN27104_c0_g1_i1:215-544(+)